MPRHESYQLVKRESPESTFLSRLRDHLRSYTTGPLTSNSPELAKLWAAPKSGTGVVVNESTALNYSAVWSAVSLLSADIASLPLMLYKRVGESGKEKMTGHPLYRVLHDEPNSEMTSMVFRETLQAHLLLWGNAYAEIVRNGGNQVVALWPLTPDRVHPYRERNGSLKYRVDRLGGGPADDFDARDIFHLPGLGFDGLSGYSVIAKAREAIGLGIATEKFGGTFFGNGSTFGGVLTHPTKFGTDTARKNFKDGIKARHQGIERAHDLLLLEEGITYAQIGVPQKDSQFLETRTFQIREIARWFKVPPHKLADLADATFSNVEQQNIDYYTSGIRPWVVRWEQEINRKLVQRSERNIQFAEHSIEGFLRGDSVARSDYYTKMFAVGAFSINKILELENLNPIGKEGDAHFVPANMMTAEHAIEGPPAPAPLPAPVAPNDTQAAARFADLQERLDDAIGEAERHLGEWRAEAERHATTGLERDAFRVQHDEVQAELVHVREILDGAETSLAAEQSERARERTEYESRDAASGLVCAGHEQRVAALSVSVADVTAECARVVGERESACAERDAALAAQAASEATAVAEKARGDALVAEVRQMAATAMESDRVALIHQETAIAAQADTAAAIVRAEQAEAACNDITMQWEAIRLEKDTAIEERDAAVAMRTVADEIAGEASAKVGRSDADTAAAIVRAEQAEADKTIAEQAQAAANLAREQAEYRATTREHAETRRMAAVVGAHRALMADAWGRMIRWEADKARKHQGTPQKFRAWVESFYDGHTVKTIDALVPVLRAHLAWLQSPLDPTAVAAAVVAGYVDESKRQLLEAVDTSGACGVALEAVLRVWERDRADGLAERLLQDAVTHLATRAIPVEGVEPLVLQAPPVPVMPPINIDFHHHEAAKPERKKSVRIQRNAKGAIESVNVDEDEE